MIPDDIADIKRGIDYIGISASFIVHDGNGNVILQKRGEHTRDEQGRWDVGGGAIEFGESIEEAVRREIFEELSCVPIEIEFFTAYDAHRELADGTKTHWIALHHIVKVDPETVKIGEPHKISEIGWFRSNNLPEPLHSQFWKSYQLAPDRGIVK